MFSPGDPWIPASASALPAARCGDLCDGDDWIAERDMRVVQIALNGVGVIAMTEGHTKSGGGDGCERKEAGIGSQRPLHG